MWAICRGGFSMRRPFVVTSCHIIDEPGGYALVAIREVGVFYIEGCVYTHSVAGVVKGGNPVGFVVYLPQEGVVVVVHDKSSVG